MPNNLTDKEIIMALEEYVDFADFQHTEYTTVRIDVLKNALELINRQEEEFKKLQDEYRWLDQESDILKADVENLNRICDEVNAENERLTAEVEKNQVRIKTLEKVAELRKKAVFEKIEQNIKLRKELETAKAEAYKEAYEKAKEILELKFDNVLNELVGDNK